MNHYVPIEVDRLKATITSDNAVSLLGANEIPDNHVYSTKVRQNTLRGVQITQGENYKIDLTAVDPEHAAVQRVSTGDDSVHLEGMSKTRTPVSQEPDQVGSGFIKVNSGAGNNVNGAAGPRTGQTPANYPDSNAGTVVIGQPETAPIKITGQSNSAKES